MHGYQVHKCRCNLCRSVNAKYLREFTAKKDKSTISHGSLTSYKTYGCRCDECKAVHAVWKKQYRLNNLDKESAYGKKWRSENKDKKREEKYRRKARELNANHGCVTAEKIAEVVLLNNGVCVYCGGTYEHIDHIVPLGRGGVNCIENLAPSCAKCNLSKGPKLLENWLTDTIDIKTLNCQLGELNG